MSAIPWLTEPLTFEQVKAHAAAHPVRGVAHGVGAWLVHHPGYPPGIELLGTSEDGWIYHLDDVRSPEQIETRTWIARWLPCTADGVPVAMAGKKMLTEIARDTAASMRTTDEDRHRIHCLPARRST